MIVIVKSVYQLDDRNPWRALPAALRPLLAGPPLPLLERRLSLRARVEEHLQLTFYNLTAVSPHSWRTYGEMRQRAAWLGLITVPDLLPAQTTEQGLDTLHIMRNIHSFTAEHNYNMNGQVFVEKISKSKHLNTINIQHIANSIRTHGAGIMNTTINFTYQFLRKKFVTFSQFLYDEHIKSRLSKDAKFYSDQQEASDQYYPLDRAVKA